MKKLSNLLLNLEKGYLIMDLEEVYLRNIDQKLQQNNSLQEETNKLLKEILRELMSKKS